MLINKITYGYSQKKRYITGRGFVDTFRNIISFVAGPSNRDLIIKPLLGAIGSLAATGLSAGVPALINHIANRNKGTSVRPDETKLLEDPKYREILQSMMNPPAPVAGVGPPVTNVIGSGHCSARRRGAGIKTF